MEQADVIYLDFRRALEALCHSHERVSKTWSQPATLRWLKYSSQGIASCGRWLPWGSPGLIALLESSFIVFIKNLADLFIKPADNIRLGGTRGTQGD